MAKGGFGFYPNKGLATLKKGFDTYFKKIKMEKPGGADEQAKIKVAIQMLNWSLNGSSKEAAVPPIKDGILRGSGSVFVERKFIADTSGEYPGGTPNKSYNGKRGQIIIGYNVSYAAKQHQNLPPFGDFKLGPVSEQSGDVSGGWLTLHLMHDCKSAMALYARLLKKLSGG